MFIMRSKGNNISMYSQYIITLFQCKGDIYIAEATFDCLAFREISGSKLSAPDNIVIAVEGNIKIETIGFGFYFDRCRAFPAGSGATVILHYQERQFVQLVGKISNHNGVESLL